MKIWQILHVILESTNQFSFKFCINLQCHQIYLLCTSLVQTLYTLIKKSPLKCKFLRFSSAPVKICQIPHVNFETTSHFFFQFCIFFHCHDKISPVNFKLIHFLLWLKESHQSPNLETFKCFGENFPNSSCHF